MENNKSNKNRYMVYKNQITHLSDEFISCRTHWFRGVYDDALGTNHEIVYLDALSLENLNEEMALTAIYLFAVTGEQKKLAKLLAEYDYHVESDMDFIVTNYLDEVGMTHLLSLDEGQSYQESTYLIMLGKFKELIVSILRHYVAFKSLKDLSVFQLTILEHLLGQSNTKDAKDIATLIIKRLNETKEIFTYHTWQMNILILAYECLYKPSEIEVIVDEMKEGQSIIESEGFLNGLIEMVASGYKDSYWKESVLFFLLKHYLIVEFFFAKSKEDEIQAQNFILHKLAYLNHHKVSENVLANSIHLFERMEGKSSFFRKYRFYKNHGDVIQKLFNAFCSYKSLTIPKIKQLKLFSDRNKAFRKFIESREEMKIHFDSAFDKTHK